MAGETPGYGNSNRILTTDEHPDHRAVRVASPRTIAGRPAEPVMSTLVSTTPSEQTVGGDARTGLIHEIRQFWQQFFVAAFDPYRPEQHYMRGPGPACRAKATPPSGT
jgi:hypothetical protein